MTFLSEMSHIPTPAEARIDPAHAPWFALVEAVEAVRLEPCADTLGAIGIALAALLAAMDEGAHP